MFSSYTKVEDKILKSKNEFYTSHYTEYYYIYVTLFFQTNMDFDQILEEIGEFGRYQKTNYFLICLPVMFAAANSLSYVFTAGAPSYRCD